MMFIINEQFDNVEEPGQWLTRERSDAWGSEVWFAFQPDALASKRFGVLSRFRIL